MVKSTISQNNKISKKSQSKESKAPVKDQTNVIKSSVDINDVSSITAAYGKRKGLGFEEHM